jgi:prephenate dehydrogenase
MDAPRASALAQARLAIVGMGLMGGSLALALRDRCGEIAGADVDPAALEFALAHGVIGRTIEFDAARSCDLLILAAPARAILAQLAALSSAPAGGERRTIVMDLGSTKAEIAAAMQSLPPQFDPIGGHPMCGKERGGIAQAEAGLFLGKAFVLTPLARTSPAALALAHELITAVGASPLVLTPDRHDALVALTSHLPYAAAAALMRTLLSCREKDVWTLAASGFRDSSRLAASDLTMMVDILLTNRGAVLDALGRFRNELDTLAALVDAGEPEALRAALAPGQARRADLFE